MRENVALVRTLRETLGDEDDIMLDCWQSFDPIYAIELAERIAEYRPRWLEECVMPDRIDSYRRVKDGTQIPLSGAEHEYTRWGFKRFIDADALDILQPDIYWAGGLSETLKIAAYASVHDLMVIPHGHSTPVESAFLAGAIAAADAVAGISGEVEHDQPALPGASGHTAAWRICAADIAGPRHGPGSRKDRGAGRGPTADRLGGEGREFGTGYYFRMHHEDLLLGVRPKTPRHFVDRAISSVIHAARAAHNQKPRVVHVKSFGRWHVLGGDRHSACAVGGRYPTSTD